MSPAVPFRLRARARVAAHVIWDQTFAPPAIAREDVPWSAEAITPAWLTAVLCADHPGAAVSDVVVDGGSAGSSVRRRLTITYNEAGDRAGLPRNLFAKTTPGLLTRITSGLVAPREANFYRTIQPTLAIETPRHFWSASDTASGRSIHLFEDIAITRGAAFCDYRTPIDREQAEDVVDLIATYHGAYHASPRFAGDLAWLPGYLTYMRGSIRGGAEALHEEAMTLAADVVPPRLMARRDEIWPMLLAGLAVHEDEPPTLSHSDVHLGNWYVTAKGRMGLCDWAIAGPGHWSRDIAYALSTMLAPADRKAWERDLLARYLARLHAAGGPEVSLEEGWARYRQQIFAALLMWTPTLCHSPTRPDMQTDAMSREMIRRITIAIDETGALDSQGGGR